MVIIKEFEINKYITLKLEEFQWGKETIIYIDGKEFRQCKHLLLVLPAESIKLVDEINSIDQAAEYLSIEIDDAGMTPNPEDFGLSQEEAFMGHCSNLQAWAENNYDTRLLHSNLSFPLLKELAIIRDSKAKKILKTEIAKRLLSGCKSTISYLVLEGFINLLDKQDIDIILEDLDFDLFLNNRNNNIWHNDISILRHLAETGNQRARNFYKNQIVMGIKNGMIKIDYLWEYEIIGNFLDHKDLVQGLINQFEAKIIFKLEKSHKIGEMIIHKDIVDLGCEGSGIVIKNDYIIGMRIEKRNLNYLPKEILYLTNLEFLFLGIFKNDDMEKKELPMILKQTKRLKKLKQIILI